ncbi:MAG: hypothetical protein RLZZ584_4276, partial [Pseudomonadota bacterium]
MAACLGGLGRRGLRRTRLQRLHVGLGHGLVLRLGGGAGGGLGSGAHLGSVGRAGR